MANLLESDREPRTVVDAREVIDEIRASRGIIDGKDEWELGLLSERLRSRIIRGAERQRDDYARYTKM